MVTLLPRRPIALVDVRVVTTAPPRRGGAEPAPSAGHAGSIRFADRVLELDVRPRSGDLVLGLDGAFVLPGLINAHDHLELNHYGTWRGHGRYRNANEWIADVGPKLEADPDARARRRWALRDRLLVGAFKNLLAGVTTVAHHNPPYPELGRGYPLRVVRRYGWAHSFGLEGGSSGARGEPAGHVGVRHRETPSGVPFIVHLGEGLDAAARAELVRFESMGCLTPNAILVHGSALSAGDWRRVWRAGAHLVWCPASNLALFGSTPPVPAWMRSDPASRPRLLLGTDAYLTGSRDLLEEMKVAQALGGEPDDLLSMVTTHAAAAFRLQEGGVIRENGVADMIVVPPRAPTPAAALLASARADLRLVVLNGQPLVGDPATAPLFRARRERFVQTRLDGALRLLAERLARDAQSLPAPDRPYELDCPEPNVVSSHA
jgi:cytosine/adenosine deaminase-related metal-dependent hydrolase